VLHRSRTSYINCTKHCQLQYFRTLKIYLLFYRRMEISPQNHCNIIPQNLSKFKNRKKNIKCCNASLQFEWDKKNNDFKQISTRRFTIIWKWFIFKYLIWFTVTHLMVQTKWWFYPTCSSTAVQHYSRQDDHSGYDLSRLRLLEAVHPRYKVPGYNEHTHKHYYWNSCFLNWTLTEVWYHISAISLKNIGHSLADVHMTIAPSMINKGPHNTC